MRLLVANSIRVQRPKLGSVDGVHLNVCGHWILYCLFYAILTNLPFWVATHQMGILPIGWFCLLYPMIGICALFVPPVFAAVLLVIATSADFLSAVSKTYYLPAEECLKNAGAVLEFSFGRILGMCGLLLLVLGIALVAAKFPSTAIKKRSRSRVVILLLSFVAAVILADYLSIVGETGKIPNPFRMERPQDVNRFSSYKNLWGARYVLVRLYRNEKMFGAKRDVRRIGALSNSPMPSAFGPVFAELEKSRTLNTADRPNVVLVIVESWGMNWSSEMRSSLVQPYFSADVQTRYTISQGVVPFNEGTVGGEARELCGSAVGMAIMNAPSSALQTCRPAQLAQAGYHTVSAHGMTGRIFSRSSWYGPIGFQESWFKAHFQDTGLPNCNGAFNGTCDASIAQWLEQRLAQPTMAPQFVYWVTLNSHLPLPVPSGLQSPASCMMPALKSEDALCSWYQLVLNAHESIAAVLTGHLARPTVFVIVGDHAPPFSSDTLRRQFSNAEVPYIVLVPKEINVAGVSRPAMFR